MANLFLAAEILEMNVTEEHNGAAFYQQVAAKSTNPLIKKQAAEIAESEKHHEAQFQNMLAGLERPEPRESYPGEYDAYVQALLKNKMFDDEEDARQKAGQWSDREALEYALKTEEATLTLLRELCKHIDAKELVIVKVTMDEEENHIRVLRDVLKRMS
jgi:rubrerythrin